MKVSLFFFVVVLSLASAASVQALGRSTAAAALGAGVVPEETHTSFRELVRAAARHALNFHKNTPLTPEQKISVKKVLEQHRAELHSLAGEGRSARQAMLAAAREAPDSAATRAAAERLGNVARDRALLTARMAAQVRPLLSAEQLQHLQQARVELEALGDQLTSTLSH